MTTLHNDGTITANDGTFLHNLASWVRYPDGWYGNVLGVERSFQTRKEMVNWLTDEIYLAYSEGRILISSKKAYERKE